ncbi:hypothetical protein [Salinigranum marinum]|uniref:hypothetical protein n=1 Tax=Salinigranum marinum TaxID=1515595 RepID=UPI002989FD86|nr:hypothetical protein [Salinigranum marinum]
MGLLSLVVLVLTALLTIAFVLTFAGVAFPLQVAVVETVDSQTADASTSTTVAAC